MKLAIVCVFALSGAVQAEGIINARNVTPTKDGFIVGKPPLPVESVAQQPVQMSPLSATPAQSNKRISGFSFSPTATSSITPFQTQPSLYESVVVTIANKYGLPPELIGGIIQARNPNWNPNFDEGNGKAGYGYGLGMITLAAAKGKSATELYDPNTNVELMAQILARGAKIYNKNVNQVIRYYFFGRAQTAGTRQEQDVLDAMSKLGFKG